MMVAFKQDQFESLLPVILLGNILPNYLWQLTNGLPM